MSKYGEPWAIEPGASRLHVLDAGALRIAAVGDAPYWQRFAEDNKANAERIVACVNFAAGCTLPDGATLAGVLTALRDCRDALRRDDKHCIDNADALLAAFFSRRSGRRAGGKEGE